MNGDWRITHHHSSALPNPSGGAVAPAPQAAGVAVDFELDAPGSKLPDLASEQQSQQLQPVAAAAAAKAETAPPAPELRSNQSGEGKRSGGQKGGNKRKGSK